MYFYYLFTQICIYSIFFFFNDTATTEIYTLSLTRRSSDLSYKSLVNFRSLKHLNDELPRGHRLVDRKSTRLNSSHLVISYAVFCLKKKKKITNDSCSVTCSN